MKKVILYILFFLVSLLVGAAIGSMIAGFSKGQGVGGAVDAFGKVASLDFVWSLVSLLVAMVCAIYVQLILHEVGHLVFGLLSGYRYSSFRIFNIVCAKIKGKYVFKRYSIAGTGGQCLMLPPDKPEKEIDTLWYNAGGVIMNVVVSAVALLLFITLDNVPNFLLNFFEMTAIMGFLFALINGIPIVVGGLPNDGKNCLFLRKSELSKHNFLVQLSLNALLQDGTEFKDIDISSYGLPAEFDYSDVLSVGSDLFYDSWLMANGRYDEAEQRFDAIFNNPKVPQIFKNEAGVELSFLAMLKGDKDWAERILDKQLRQYIKVHSGSMSSKKRVVCAISLVLDDNREQAVKIYNELVSDKDKYLMQGEVKTDIALLDVLFGKN